MLLSIAPASGVGAQEPIGADACALPPALRAAVQEAFGSSRILTPNDLYEDERAIFRREYKGACPGLTTGQFFGRQERPATAMVLMGVGPKKDMRLVAARPALSSWTFVELDQMDAGGTPVVSTARPGALSSLPETMARRNDRDVVLLTALETWQRGYLWNGRSFEKTELSY